MSVLQAAVLVAMLAGGLWLGVIVTIAVERVSVWKRMSPAEFAADFRRSVLRIDPLQPILAIVTAVGALLLALKVDAGAARSLAWAVFALVVAVIVASLSIGEPINTKFRRRDEGDAPPEVELLRDRWISFHRARTVVAIGSRPRTRR